MTLILFGFTHSGKTHLGKKLSEQLGCPHLDTDTSLRNLYSQLGEEQFRALEQQTILNIPLSFQGIISLGGGAILNPKSQEYLQKIGTLIYLKVPFDIIRSRLKTLPAFASSFEELQAIYLKREPLYTAIPAITVDNPDIDTLRKLYHGF